MNENEINVTTTCIMALANQPNAEEKIKLLPTNLFASYPQKDNFDVQSNSNSQTISTSITFTQKEIEKIQFKIFL